MRDNLIVGTSELTDVINLVIRLSAQERKSRGEIVRARFGRAGLRILVWGVNFSWSQLLPAWEISVTAVLVPRAAIVTIHMSAETITRSPLPIVINERMINKTSWVTGERRGLSDDCVLRRIIAPFLYHADGYVDKRLF